MDYAIPEALAFGALSDVSLPPPAVAAAAVVAAVTTFELLRRWAAWMETSGRYAETTRRQYRRYVVAFLADVLIPLEHVTEDDVVEHLAGLPAKGHMRGQTLRALHSFYRYAEPRSLVTQDPTRFLYVPPKKYGDAPYLTDEELTEVLDAAGKLDPRARPSLELMYATGARVSSLCGVEPSDVDLNHLTISFRVAKGDRPYSVPLGKRGLDAARALLELKDYAPPRSGGRRPTLVGVAPVIVQRWCQQVSETVGFRVWPHLLRHTFAERLANDPEIPELVWTELMNHRDAALIRRYAVARLPLKRQAVAAL